MTASVGTPAPRDSWADALEEARELEGLSMEQRYARFAQACRLAFRMLEGAPNRQAILDYQEPLPEASRALLERAREVRPRDE